MQPICPRCNLNPTAYTLQIDDDTWQDVCTDCYNKAIADKEVVVEVTAVPIEPMADSTEG